jgi:catechol 2,3-dioxygenase-like lactoylglutathione lyase family enzyme
MATGISYIFLAVDHLDPMIDFYERVMSLEMYFRVGDDWAFLHAPHGDGAKLALYHLPQVTGESPLFAVDVSSLDSYINQPERAELKTAMIEQVPGGRVVRLPDPEGNWVELHEASPAGD